MRRAGMILLLAAVTTASCRRQESAQQPPKEEQTIHVLASVYPVADMVRQIGGQWVSVDWVVESPQDVRDVQGSEKLTRRMDWAQLIVTSGYADAWASANLAPAEQARALLRPEQFPQGSRMSAKNQPTAAASGSTRPCGWTRWWPRSWLRKSLSLWAIGMSNTPLSFPPMRLLSMQRCNGSCRGRRRDLPRPSRKNSWCVRPGWSALAQRIGLQEIAPLNGRVVGLSDAQARLIRQTAVAQQTNLLVVDSPLPPELWNDLAERTGLQLRSTRYDGIQRQPGTPYLPGDFAV